MAVFLKPSYASLAVLYSDLYVQLSPLSADWSVTVLWLLVPTNASRDVRYVSMIVPAMMATARSNAPTAVIPRHRPVRSCISYSLSFSISAGIFDGENPVPPVCLNIRRRISVAS